ncbi:MAG: O-antigen ligase family protein [Xanthomonadales bacterium]|nr:O-antigen ligase family protein [Xanthomonadales bacterium]
MVLIGLACSVLLATVFDTWVISQIPILRTMAGVLGVVLAICWMLYRIRGIQVRRGAMIWMLVLLVTIIYVDLLRYLDTGHLALANSMQWIQPILFGLILLDLSRDDRAAWYLFNSVLLSIAFLVFMALFGGIEEGIRSGSDLMNLNAQSYYFGLMSIALYVFVVERWPKFTPLNIVIGIAMIIMVLMMLRTGSRGGVAAALTGFAVATWLLMRSRNMSAYISLIPFMMAAGVLLVLSSDAAVRWSDTLSGEDYGYRDVIWAAAIEMVRESPWLGHGGGFVADLGDQTRGRNTTTHNQYLMLLIGYGLVGLIIWLSIMGAVIRRCWRHRRHPMAVALLAMIACSLVYGMAADLTFKRYFWVIVALAANIDIIVSTYPTAGHLREAQYRRDSQVLSSNSRMTSSPLR